MHLTRVVELDPANPRGHYWLAQALAGLGEMEPALLSYAKAMKLDPRVDVSPGLHHLLADGYLQKRQFRDAIGHEERALALAQAEGDSALAATSQEGRGVLPPVGASGQAVSRSGRRAHGLQNVLIFADEHGIPAEHFAGCQYYDAYVLLANLGFVKIRAYGVIR